MKTTKLPTSSEQPQEAGLQVISCTKTFSGLDSHPVVAADRISLAIPRATIVSVVGSNGAGKSTLLGMISGTAAPDAGRILIQGKEVTGDPSWKRTGLVACVRQNPEQNMLSSLTIEENLALAFARRTRHFRLRLASRALKRQSAQELLEPLGMGLEGRLGQVAGTLSGGQRQAVAMAMAAITQPAVLLLDEHTAALDPGSAATVTRLSQTFARESGASTLIVTHNMASAISGSDRLLMMHRGRIVLDIEGLELKALSSEELVKRFTAATGGSLEDRTILEN